MILVVDDDPEVLEQAPRILNGDRHVFLASTAAQALNMVQRLGFSVVLVDLELQAAMPSFRNSTTAIPIF
jgi:CheY-like chemotaxis protein